MLVNSQSGLQTIMSAVMIERTAISVVEGQHDVNVQAEQNLNPAPATNGNDATLARLAPGNMIQTNA